MGSGKTTIARLLSEKLQIPAIDLDKTIEEKMNLSIPDIFHQKGEIYFRKLEHQSFKELLALQDTLIISLGGGTPCYANNHELLNGENVVSIYLKASIAELVKRLSYSEGRPLLAGMNNDEKQEFIAKHLFDRSYYYNQAQFVVSVDAKSPDEIVNEVKAILA